MDSVPPDNEEGVSALSSTASQVLAEQLVTTSKSRGKILTNKAGQDTLTLGPDLLSALPTEVKIKIIARLRMNKFLTMSHVSRGFRALFKDHAVAIHNTAVRTRFPAAAKFLQCVPLKDWGWLVPQLPQLLQLEDDLETFIRRRLTSDDPSVSRQDIQSWEFDFKLTTPGPQLLYMLEHGLVISRREGRVGVIDDLGWYGMLPNYIGDDKIGRYFSKKKCERRFDEMVAAANATVHVTATAYLNSHPGFQFAQSWNPMAPGYVNPQALYAHVGGSAWPGQFVFAPAQPVVPAQPINTAQPAYMCPALDPAWGYGSVVPFNPADPNHDWLAWQGPVPIDSVLYENYTWDKDRLDVDSSDDEFGISDIIMGNCLQKLSDVKTVYSTPRPRTRHIAYKEMTTGNINYSRPKELTWFHGVPDWFVPNPPPLDPTSIWAKYQPKPVGKWEVYASLQPEMRRERFSAPHPHHIAENLQECINRLLLWRDLYSWFPANQPST